jgi:GDP-L-fucose synthase
MKKLVFGATGLLGSAFMRKYPTAIVLSSKDINCLSQSSIADWFSNNLMLFEDEVDVFLCMGKVAGIKGQNDLDMMTENALMALNMLTALATFLKKGRVIYFSSSCVYPRGIVYPLKPEDLLKASPERSNEGYALAKIIGTKFIEYMNDDRFYCVVPPNLCGPNDNWDSTTSHVLQSMVRKICDAKDTDTPTITFWGDPSVRREYLYVDDLVDGVECFIQNTRRKSENPRVVHIGYGADFTLSSWAHMVANRANYHGIIEFDGSHSGNPRKLLDISYMRFKLDWRSKYTVFGIVDNLIKDYMEWKMQQKNI